MFCGCGKCLVPARPQRRVAGPLRDDQRQLALNPPQNNRSKLASELIGLGAMVSGRFEESHVVGTKNWNGCKVRVSRFR